MTIMYTTNSPDQYCQLKLITYMNIITANHQLIIFTYNKSCMMYIQPLNFLSAHLFILNYCLLIGYLVTLIPHILVFQYQ